MEYRFDEVEAPEVETPDEAVETPVEGEDTEQ